MTNTNLLTFTVTWLHTTAVHCSISRKGISVDLFICWCLL